MREFLRETGQLWRGGLRTTHTSGGGTGSCAVVGFAAVHFRRILHTPFLITWRRSEKMPWAPVASAKRTWDEAMVTIEAEFGARWRWHDIRAAYITQVAMTSPSAAVVQSMARHADFATTQLYIEVADQLRVEAAERATQRPALRMIGGRK